MRDLRRLISSLRVRLALLVLLAIIPALGLSVYNFVAQRRHATAATYAEANRLAKLAIASQEQLMADTLRLLVVMAHHSGVRRLDPTGCSTFAASLMSPIFANLGASNANGDVFCSALVMQAPVNNADRAYFRGAMKRRGFAVGEYQVGRITGKPTLNVGYPVIGDSDQIIAVVTAAIDLDWLNQLASRAELPPGGTLAVLDRRGKILARYPDHQAWQGRDIPDSALFKAILSRNGEGIASVSGLDGEPRFYAFQKLRIEGNEEQLYVAVGTPTAFAFGKINREFARNLISLGLVTLVALAATWVTGNALILQPTEALVRSARLIAAGDRSARVAKGNGTGELGQLALAFNEMAESLQHQEAERKQAEADRLARQAAEVANRAKSEFLSRMSHELRTPLNAIIGFGQLMEMDAATPEQHESVEQILKAGRHLLNLINEILDIARIEAGRLSLSIEPVALQEIVAECQDLIRPAAAQRRIVLDLQSKVDRQVVMADRQRLKQVILNLLSNAVKFNADGGRVALSCDPGAAGQLRIRVTDTGPGISPEHLIKLFTPFERLGAGQTGIEGTGLGLALSKSLVEAMNGVIGVESTIGRGSTFWVELPIAKETAEQRSEEPPTAAAAGVASARRALTVLYIEDNLSNLKLLERVMARRPDIRLLTAMQGRLGLDLARQHHPDLILLDLDLPDIRGDQVLHTLRNDATTRDIPVVMITATATPGEIQRLLDSGAKAYLTKPFDVKALFKLLDEVVAA